ncbi:alpha/beta fold hydrolase [Nocardia sp. 2]|uniref:Alpha/beta fold hydrolase n=1 Tax=Nocardia acididurans TaxID=2802282 RepID=A0ABS1MBC8_9NOCA|nr:alpha/beta fold hydrolase [Nocardia acididurans]MBL1077960.1 alpha/beta fold hydrolase [Nocardia acididurans]
MSTIYKSEAGARAVQEQYRELLRAWPVPFEERHVPTREGDTYVRISGPEDAPPLVLLHGSGANSTNWLGDIASWATYFRTYSIDIVGEPGGSAPSRPKLGTEAVALWLDDVLAGLDISETAMVAMSLGGWHALDYAIRRPGRITRLALLCPGGVGRQRYGWMFKSILAKLTGRGDVRSSARLVTGLDDEHLEPVLDTIVSTFTHFTPRTERLPVFTDAQLRTLTMPVLVIVGDRDVMLDSAETARRITASVPNATVEVLPGVGHAVLGQTETVTKFLRA